MIRTRIVVWQILAIFLLYQPSWGADLPYAMRDARERQHWGVGLYVGPASSKYVGAVLQDFNLQSHEYMIGLTLDRKLARLWGDVYLSSELQVTQYFNGHANTTFAGMLGFEVDKLFGYRHTSFSFYDGPSYALDPPYVSIGYKHRTYRATRKKFLNAIAVEFASGVPYTENWDWTVRFYHRSGVFGLYSEGCDDGLTAGLGLKYHF